MSQPRKTISVSLFTAALLLLFVSIPVRAALAASVTVTVQQAGSNTPAQAVTCTLLQKTCNLPFTINAGQSDAQTINIHIAYGSGEVTASFKAVNGFFYTEETVGKINTYSLLWVRTVDALSKPYAVTLFGPLAASLIPNPYNAPKSYSPVAELNISATTGS